MEHRSAANKGKRRAAGPSLEPEATVTEGHGDRRACRGGRTGEAFRGRGLSRPGRRGDPQARGGEVQLAETRTTNPKAAKLVPPPTRRPPPGGRGGRISPKRMPSACMACAPAGHAVLLLDRKSRYLWKYRNPCLYFRGESIVPLSKLHNVNNIILGLANSSFTDSLKTRKVPNGRTLSFLPSYPILLLPEATACLLKQPERTLAVQLLSVNGEKGNLNEFKYAEVFSVSKPFTQKSFTRGGNIWLTHIAHVPSGG